MEPAARASSAGAFFSEKISNTTIGITPPYQLTSPVSNNPCLNASISPKLAADISGERNANKMSDIINAGIVVHPIFFI